MGELGPFALRLGLFFSSYALLIDLLGLWRGRRELLRSGRNATIGSLLCLTVATAALWILLVQGDFAVSYVAEHTSRALPLVYKFTALWAGAAGSLLFWLWLQSGFVVLVFARSDGSPPENSSLIPWLTATVLLHCGRTYRAGTRIATWFLVLAILTFSLCIFARS